jgi:hypothetical protein
MGLSSHRPATRLRQTIEVAQETIDDTHQ